MGFPFFMVITAVLKGNVLGFGDPVAKEMTDFGAFIRISVATRMAEGVLAALVAVRNRE